MSAVTQNLTAGRIATSWHDRDEWSKKNGLHATVHSACGENYTGEWKQNLRHGRGRHIGPNQSFIYEGQWAQDERCGFGSLLVQTTSAKSQSGMSGGSRPLTKEQVLRTIQDSILGIRTQKSPTSSSSTETPPSLFKVYTGDWKNNQRNGIGTGFYELNGKYQGHWKNDVRSGWGTMYYPDGSRYDGEWCNDVRHGQGILLLANHDRFEGIFVNDLKEGPGKFFYKQSRQVYVGEWCADVPKCGSIQDCMYRGLARIADCFTCACT